MAIFSTAKALLLMMIGAMVGKGISFILPGSAVIRLHGPVSSRSARIFSQSTTAEPLTQKPYVDERLLERLWKLKPAQNTRIMDERTENIDNETTHLDKWLQARGTMPLDESDVGNWDEEEEVDSETQRSMYNLHHCPGIDWDEDQDVDKEFYI